MDKLNNIPSPGKDKQMNLPDLDIKQAKKFEQLELPPFKELEKKEINWGPKYFPEGGNSGRYAENEVDNLVELKDGEWFINKNEKSISFLEADEIMKRGQGLKVALQNKKFKRIYDHFQRTEGLT